VFIENMRAACVREVRYLRTHPWDLALISWVPALALSLVWAIFSAGVSTKLPVAFLDEDHSQLSRKLQIALDATRAVAIAAQPQSFEDAVALVRERKAYAIIQVPRDWERRTERGDPLPVVLYTNEQYHAANSSISSDALGAVGSVIGARGLAALAALGGGFSGAQMRADALHVDLRSLYSPSLSFERALTGAFLPAILHLFALGAAAFAIGREFRDGTAAEWLQSAGGNMTAALAGKLLPLLCCFAVLGTAAMVWLVGYRGWSANGSLLMCSAGFASLMLACCAIPALLVGLTGTLRVALAVCAITNVTAVSFTGFTYPLYSMTTTAKVWSQMLPFHYFFEILQEQWSIGSPVSVSLVPLALLWAVFIVPPFALAMPRLAKRCREPAGWGLR